jgi:glycosyltransferase involved in cell wall biosynthesis
LKILQTPARFYPFIGGVENYVYYLSQELVRLGHDVKVLCANEPPSKKEEIINGIKVKRLPYIAKIANTNLTPTLPLEIARSDFDVLHAHLPTPWSADWSMILAKLKNKPLILSYYNDIIGSGFSDYVARFYNSTALKLVLKRAARIIIIQENYLEFSPHLSPYEEKIVVVPCGVDIQKFRPIKMEENKYSLFFLSVLDEFHQYKGLDYLLQALQEVKKELPQVKLIVGGKGKLLPFYEEKARDLGLMDNVEFTDFIPEDKLLDYYNQCQAFVLPSTSSAQEGFGIVALEALACAKPVISTEIVGIAKDIKNNNLGTIVPPCDSDSLAEAIVEVLSTASNSNKMGKRGRKVVKENYTWLSVAKRTESIYLDVL